MERTEDGQYRAGLPLRTIGSTHAAPPSIVERAPDVLEDLAAVTHFRARLGVLRELEVAYIQKEPGPQPATAFSAAATLPALATALGRVLLAFSPQRTVELTILRGLRQYPPHTVTTPARLRRSLGVTRLTRIAVAKWQLEPGICGVGVPVFGSGGEVVAAIELTVRDLGTDLQPILGPLSNAARSLSRELAGATATQPETAEPRHLVAVGH